MNLGDSTTYTVTDQDAAGSPNLVAGEELHAVVTGVAEDGVYTVAVFGTDATLTARTVNPNTNTDSGSKPADAPAPTAPASAPAPAPAPAPVVSRDPDLDSDAGDVSANVGQLTDAERQSLRDALAAYDSKDKSNPATPSDTPIGDSVATDTAQQSVPAQDGNK